LFRFSQKEQAMSTRLSQLLEYLFASTPPGTRASRSRRPGKNRRIPTLELLETRATPSVTWNNNPADGQIDVTGGETVVVGESDNFKLDVMADGQDLAVQQAASSIQKLTINATNGFANNIDLSGINVADFSTLSTVVVNLDARDTVNRGSGWAAAGTETLNGQRFLDFRQGNVTLKITDFAPQARGIVATLIHKRFHGKSKLFVQVSFADTGALKSQFLSPLQHPPFNGVHVSVADSNGDGIADTVVLTGSKHGRTTTLQLPG
jgi:hypothetical protein